MNDHQKIALEHPCRSDDERTSDRYRYTRQTHTVVLTVDLDPDGLLWHSSTASLPGFMPVRDILRNYALDALRGVGDASLGEWEEWTGYAFHVRRRLTEREQRQVGEVVDVRGTPEAQARYERVRRYLPPGTPVV
jgi:hypothetical protein